METAGPVAGISSEAPSATVPPLAVTFAVWPVPTAETVLPTLSVTATLALTLPPLPRPVMAQVKRQGEPIAPAVAVTLVSAHLAAAPVATVKATGAVAIAPSLALTLAAPA